MSDQSNKNYSNSTNRDYYTIPEYYNRYVGGGNVSPSDKQEYLRTQTNLINKSNQQLPPPIHQQSGIRASGYTKEGRYDPLEDYKYQHGLMGNHPYDRIYKKTYVDINSKDRNKKTTMNTGDGNILPKDPLTFKNGNNIMTINLHRTPTSQLTFEVGDRIAMSGVIGRDVSTMGNCHILNTYIYGNPTFDIPNNSNVMTISYKHGLPNGKIIPIELYCIKGDNDPTPFEYPILGNIPTNLINKQHNATTVVATGLEFLTITLDQRMWDKGYKLATYNYKIINNSIAGIAINFLNAGYPTNNIDRLQGFHEIVSVNPDDPTEKNFISSIGVQLHQFAEQNVLGGGSNIIIYKILSINEGYPDANNYTIDLNNTYIDVLTVRLASIEFPHAEYLINDDVYGDGGELIKAGNSKLYWDNIDQNLPYETPIPPGIYTPKELETVLNESLTKIVLVQSGDPKFPTSQTITVNIDEFTNIASFTSFKNNNIPHPIISIDPTPTPANADKSYTLTIFHPNHGIPMASLVTITGAITDLGIDASDINGTHFASYKDDDHYTITVGPVNLNSPPYVNTKGGNTCTLTLPYQFRLRFDQPDTIGEILGFKDPGESTSITTYGVKILNITSYEDEQIIPGNFPPPLHPASLHFSRSQYAFMVAYPIFSITSITPIKSAFAKIILHDNKFITNDFVPMDRFFPNTLHELRQLEIAFYDDKGNLYQTHTQDHSFTIEIITAQETPVNTGLSATNMRHYARDVPKVRRI